MIAGSMTLTVSESLFSAVPFGSLKIISFCFFGSVEEKKRKSLENIMEAKAKVKSEITILKDKLKLARETIAKFKTELAKVQPSNSQ